jgi:hypothetical protein
VAYFKKSRWGCFDGILQKLLAKALKMLRTMTKKAADHLALKPTATIEQAARPKMETNSLAILHSPWMMKPMNRKIRRTRPARRKLEGRKVSFRNGYIETTERTHYFLRSVSLIEGRPANNFFLVIIDSLNTMKRPPMTERLRRKKVRSKMRP